MPSPLFFPMTRVEYLHSHIIHANNRRDSHTFFTSDNVRFSAPTGLLKIVIITIVTPSIMEAQFPPNHDTIHHIVIDSYCTTFHPIIIKPPPLSQNLSSKRRLRRRVLDTVRGYPFYAHIRMAYGCISPHGVTTSKG